MIQAACAHSRSGSARKIPLAAGWLSLTKAEVKRAAAGVANEAPHSVSLLCGGQNKEHARGESRSCWPETRPPTIGLPLNWTPISFAFAFAFARAPAPALALVSCWPTDSKGPLSERRPRGARKLGPEQRELDIIDRANSRSPATCRLFYYEVSLRRLFAHYAQPTKSGARNHNALSGCWK